MSYLFCVRLNSALKLQHTLQVKVKIHVLSGNNHGRCQNIGIYFCVRLNLAPRLQHTLQVKAKENTFCIRLNLAPKLQHTLQENENTCKNKEMFNLNYAPSDHLCKLRVALQVPVLFPPYMSGELDIPGLDCNTSCMDGQKVGILHDCYQIVLSSLMQGLNCTSCPPEWTFVNFSPCQFLVSDVGGIPF